MSSSLHSSRQKTKNKATVGFGFILKVLPSETKHDRNIDIQKDQFGNILEELATPKSCNTNEQLFLLTRPDPPPPGSDTWNNEAAVVVPILESGMSGDRTSVQILPDSGGLEVD